MPRQKKDARILHMKLDRHLYDLLEASAKATGKTKTEMVEEMLSEHLLQAGAKNPEWANVPDE